MINGSFSRGEASSYATAAFSEEGNYFGRSVFLGKLFHCLTTP